MTNDEPESKDAICECCQKVAMIWKYSDAPGIDRCDPCWNKFHRSSDEYVGECMR